MNPFHSIIHDIRNVVTEREHPGLRREWTALDHTAWPASGPRDIVLLPDLAVELVPPGQASLSLLLWTDADGRVSDRRITLIGPDIGETDQSQLPFAKVVLVQTEPCDDDLAYERYRDMDLVRFDLSLKGYMLRAASQDLREWSRISREAVDNGFSLRTLGSALISAFSSRPFVRRAEVIFVTQSSEDVMALSDPALTAHRLIQAMNKMIREMEADCGNCEYQDVCSDASDMQALRKTLAEKRQRERINAQ